jgi:Extensin-like protein C-terminus
MAKLDQWLFEALPTTNLTDLGWQEIGTASFESPRGSIKYVRDRCKNPGTKVCPSIPNLLTVTGIDGIPFEYPNPRSTQRSSSRGLYTVSKDRQINRRQQFIPSVSSALSLFVQNMQRFGMPIEAILTDGSLYCRCITGTDTLSNHSFGDAIDIVGVRWAAGQSSLSRSRETIVHNFRDPEQRALLRRINACLRISFATVIDYNYNVAHQDHFHCDMNQGKGRILTGKTSMVFLREALTHVLKITIPVESKTWNAQTKKALQTFSRLGPELFTQASRPQLNRVLDQLFEQIARG